MKDPLLETFPLSHPRRQLVERSLGVGPFVRISSAPSAPMGYCYWNVQKQVERFGGEAIYGWLILQWPKLYVEALHHAIWKSPSGDLIDITDKYPTDGRPFSVFAADDSADISLDAPVFVPTRHFKLSARTEVAALLDVMRRQLDHKRDMMGRILAETGASWSSGEGVALPSYLLEKYAADLELSNFWERELSSNFRKCAALTRGP